MRGTITEGELIINYNMGKCVSQLPGGEESIKRFSRSPWAEPSPYLDRKSVEVRRQTG